MSDESQLMHLKLKVVPTRSELNSVPVLYSNYAEVLTTPEETYLTFYMRMDQAAKIDGEYFVSEAIPKQVVMISNEHARRLLGALTAQLGGSSDGTESEG